MTVRALLMDLAAMTAVITTATGGTQPLLPLTSSYFLLTRASLKRYSVGSMASTRGLASRSRQYTELPLTCVMYTGRSSVRMMPASLQGEGEESLRNRLQKCTGFSDQNFQISNHINSGFKYIHFSHSPHSAHTLLPSYYTSQTRSQLAVLDTLQTSIHT